MQYLAELSSAIATIVISLVGWYTYKVDRHISSVEAKHDGLAAKHGALEVMVVGEYVKKDELRAMQAAFKEDMKDYLDGVRDDVRASVNRIEAQVNTLLANQLNQLNQQSKQALS